MAQPLPRLRLNLDFMPSPVEDRPGLLIRDSYGYSNSVLIVPPPLVPCLECFDGEQTESDLRILLVKITGELDVSPIVKQLTDTLREAGFLHDETYAAMREVKEKQFAASPVRKATHAGSAYPPDKESATTLLDEYMGANESSLAAEDDRLIALAAPHVSPFGGWETYRAAYSCLGPVHRDRTFVVLGTSHYGEPDRFGLTRKPFETPFGTSRINQKIIDELAREPAARMEDYCHAVEHSIEFQVLFLQHLFGPEIEIVPILCGPFARSILQGGLPEDNDEVRSFIDRLGDIGVREGRKLLWVMGIDMAHMGSRYGDSFEAVAGEGEMETVARRDQQRIAYVNKGDADGFWSSVQEGQDDLKWCGSAPLYTFLRAVPDTQGTLRGYEQWNIDESSVVSFAGLSFRPASRIIL